MADSERDRDVVQLVGVGGDPSEPDDYSPVAPMPAGGSSSIAEASFNFVNSIVGAGLIGQY